MQVEMSALLKKAEGEIERAIESQQDVEDLRYEFKELTGRLEECGRLGDIAARLSITKMGARQGLPTLDELAQRYQELYNKEL